MKNFKKILQRTEKFPGTMIEKSFKQCCISNSWDGTDDEVLRQVIENECSFTDEGDGRLEYF